MAVKQFIGKVAEKKNVAPNFWEIYFDKPEGLGGQAGQYLSVKVNEEGERRDYSLASRLDEDKLRLMVDVAPMGKGSTLFYNCKVGDEMELMGPMGNFFLRENADSSGLLFVATGSGVVPFRPMIYELLEKGEKRPVRLHWGMKTDGDLFWVEEWKELADKYENFEFDIVLSREGPESVWHGCRGHVQDCLVGHEQIWNGWEAYLCGNQSMIEDVQQLLVTRGIVKEKVYFEKFY